MFNTMVYLRIAELIRQFGMDENFYKDGEIELLVNTIDIKEKTKLFDFINSLMWVEYTVEKIVKTDPDKNDIEYVQELKQTHFEIVNNFSGDNSIIFRFDRNPLYNSSTAKLVLDSKLLSEFIVKINKITIGRFHSEDLNSYILNMRNNSYYFNNRYRNNY